jgi:hypothetical protein
MSDTSFFDCRGIEVKRLPAWVLSEAEGIIKSIEAGTHFQAVGGKRMQFDRSLISIPVGPKHRMLAVEIDGRIRFRKLMTHEDYNKYAKKVRL